MRVLYGVNGEGMGHATRSQVVIDDLLERHDVRVMASQAAFTYLSERLPDGGADLRPQLRDAGRRDPPLGDGASRTSATRAARCRTRFATGCEAIHAWRPDVVITDFEPLVGIYARTHRVPMIAVDNINMLDRCRHDEEVIGAEQRGLHRSPAR